MAKKTDFVTARIEEDKVKGLFNIVNDDTSESMGTGFQTREIAEQFALDHDCDILHQGD